MQIDLFNHKPRFIPRSLPYAKERPTSKEGAKAALPSAGTQCHTILMALSLAGNNGLTASELRLRCDIKQASTMSARLNSLMKAGKINDSGLRRKNVESNVNQIVWALV